MTYGSKQYKNGKTIGYLIFDSGKKVFLDEKEKREFEIKIDYWENVAVEKYRIDYAKSEKMGWGMK